jgi:hypothetical protein
LIDSSILPAGWDLSEGESTTVSDPTTNHVSRTWRHHVNGSLVWESVWRAYTIDDAKDKYHELSQEFGPPRISTDGHIYVEFRTPAEIDFRSQLADEYHLACRWWDRPYCLAIARYRNYAVELRMDQQAELNGVQASGLTYSEMEALIKATDARFAEFLGQLATPTTVP